MTRHSTLRRLQRERRFVAMEADDDANASFDESLFSTADPLADLSRHETAEAVRQAVLGLPLHYREAVLLCHLHELSYAEAAEVIGCEIGTVCSRLYRARALLAQRLAALKPEPAPRVNLNLARYAL
jgi:RNA polymerase sigma-70 factor (ECF subfamily)